MRPIIYCLLLLLAPWPLFAQSTITCHCFQNRSFNPQTAAAADPYFLATAQNSLMARLYGLDKKELVRAKMSGSDGDQLWVLHELAYRSGQPVAAIETLYSRAGQWPAVLRQLNLPDDFSGGAGSTAEMARAIVDGYLQQRLLISSENLLRGRAAGMSSKELILGGLLAADPLSLFMQVSTGSQTWGKLLFEAGLLDGAAISGRIEQRLSGR